MGVSGRFTEPPWGRILAGVMPAPLPKTPGVRRFASRAGAGAWLVAAIAAAYAGCSLDFDAPFEGSPAPGSDASWADGSDTDAPDSGGAGGSAGTHGQAGKGGQAGLGGAAGAPGSGGSAGGGGAPGSGGSAGSPATGGTAGAAGTMPVALTGCEGAGDPYWSNVVVYVPCTATLNDETGKSSITVVNQPAIDASPAGAKGGASCRLGNGGSYATANGFKMTLPALGTLDFTLELSVYFNAWTDPTDGASRLLVADDATDTGLFSADPTSKLQFVEAGKGLFSDPEAQLGTWIDYAVTRQAGVIRVFENGAFLKSHASTLDYAFTAMDVSCQYNGAYNALMGSANQLRITAGTARYTSDYPPCPGAFATETLP